MDTHANANSHSEWPQTLYRVEAIGKSYFGTEVLRDINLELLRGEVHGIIGKNGAGKSTLVNIMHGSERPSVGTLTIGGRPVDQLTPKTAHDMGVVLIPQKTNYPLELSVAETLYLGTHTAGRFGMINMRKLREDAGGILARIGLDLDPNELLANVPLEDRRLIEVARALWVHDAQVLILDETTAALSVNPREKLFEIMRETTVQENRCFIFISHRLEEMIDICDRITVLRNGELVATKDLTDLSQEGLAELITGGRGQSAETAPVARQITNPEYLKLTNVSRPGEFLNISLSVGVGEIVGITGIVGSGYSELLRHVGGVSPGGSGEIIVGGKQIIPRSPKKMKQASVGYLTHNREEEALFHGLSIQHNAVGSAFTDFASNFGLVNRQAVQNSVIDLKSKLDIKMGEQVDAIDTLSGGNKQKIIVGRLLGYDLDAYLFDEIAEGVDISARRVLLEFVRDHVSPNAAVLMASNVVSDLMEICDRILVMYQGEITCEFQKTNYDEHDIYSAVQGLGGDVHVGSEGE